MNKYATFNDLKDTSVFITGGGSGIGAALTEGFLEQGAQVAFVQRSDPTELLEDLEQRYGRRPLFIQCDVTDVPALQAAIATAAAKHGTISVLVNNAANDKRHTIAEMTVADWDQNHAVNLRPYFFASQAVVPGMQKQGGGAIINYSSISYMMGNAGYPVYATANGAITALTRSLARELGPDKIRVNGIAPGWVLTTKQLKMWATPELLAAHMNKQCLKEHLQPADMVGATLFLASQVSRMMTGQVMAVDGGVVVSG